MDIMGIFEEFVGIVESEDGKDMEYGLPELKKYPLYDKKHVLAAIKFFNYCEDSEDQKTLARAIIKKMKEYGISPESVGDENNLKKFVERSSILDESVDLSMKAPSLFYFERRLKPSFKKYITDAIENWMGNRGADCKLEELFLLNPGDDVEVEEVMIRAVVAGPEQISGEEFKRGEHTNFPMHFYINLYGKQPTDGKTAEYNILTGEWIR